MKNQIILLGLAFGILTANGETFGVPVLPNSADGYAFVKPNVTNYIKGIGMGPSKEYYAKKGMREASKPYKMLRSEDIAFLQNAFTERLVASGLCTYENAILDATNGSFGMMDSPDIKPGFIGCYRDYYSPGKEPFKERIVTKKLKAPDQYGFFIPQGSDISLPNPQTIETRDGQATLNGKLIRLTNVVWFLEGDVPNENAWNTNVVLLKGTIPTAKRIQNGYDNLLLLGDVFFADDICLNCTNSGFAKSEQRKWFSRPDCLWRSVYEDAYQTYDTGIPDKYIKKYSTGNGSDTSIKASVTVKNKKNVGVYVSQYQYPHVYGFPPLGTPAIKYSSIDTVLQNAPDTNTIEKIELVTINTFKIHMTDTQGSTTFKDETRYFTCVQKGEISRDDVISRRANDYVAIQGIECINKKVERIWDEYKSQFEKGSFSVTETPEINDVITRTRTFSFDSIDNDIVMLIVKRNYNGRCEIKD